MPAPAGLSEKLAPLFGRLFRPLLDERTRRAQPPPARAGRGRPDRALARAAGAGAGGAEDAALRQQVGVPGGGRHARRHAAGADRRACCARWAPTSRGQPEVTRLPGLRRHRRADQLQRAGAPVLPARRRRGRRPAGEPGRQGAPRRRRATPSPPACARRCRRSASATAPTSRWSRCRPARRCCRRSWPRSTGPMPKAGARWPRPCAPCSSGPPAWSTSTTAASPPAPRKLLLVDRRKAALLGVPQQAIVGTLRAGLAGEAAAWLHDAEQVPGGGRAATARRAARRPRRAAAAGGARRRRPAGADPRAGDRDRHRARAADLPQGPAAGELRHRRHGRRGGQPAVRHVRHARRHRRDPRRPTAARWPSTSSASPPTPTATTRSSGTANGRSPTRPSATWAPPTRWGWC